ncbi:hypothetical protein KUTeg_015299 [Tegillarca granosa]|uniref:Centrosomal protein of 70 kDa n=1 Tax=Tegillarca granosa TaxID=220873 RepID=A0ABQ9EUZ0_TEGGR|nr:hypothetical protein KUTeg_015299 [Tegillarca granosa]
MVIYILYASVNLLQGRGTMDDEREERSTDYQTEIDEWAEVNRILKRHGLPVVKFLHPSDVALMSERNLCMDLPMGKNVRQNLASLMADCDHRQALIQDLIITNNKLKIGEPDDVADVLSTSSTTPELSQNIKSLIKSYEKQLRESDRKIKKLEEEKELVKLEMGSRAILSLGPIKDISMEAEAEDLERVVPCIQKLREQADMSDRYEKFCRRVHDLVEEEKTNNKQRSRSISPSRRKDNHLTDKQLHNVLAVLQNWNRDQEDLQELQLSVNKLSDRVAPWLKLRMTGDPTVSQILGVVDKLVFDDGIARDKMYKEWIKLFLPSEH